MENQIISALRRFADKKRKDNLQRYFKTGKGEYGEGDIFLGITVPQIRSVAKEFKDTSFQDVERLLCNLEHEIRLCALLILVGKARQDKKKAYEIYISNTRYINNWDLVDLTAPDIVGGYLNGKDKRILEKLAQSNSLWERRIAIMATFYFIKKGQCEDSFKIAQILLYDKHDLIHKAVGWMLREAGKRCSLEKEEDFLKKYASEMPRTMLRYAIEKFSQEKRSQYLKKIT